ncbi:MAG: SDR family oxidoreductase [Aliidongia sp.]
MVEPDEVAEAVVFLCRNESAAMTGQSLIIAGGEVM